MTPETLKGWLNIDVRINTEAVAIKPDSQTVVLKNLLTNATTTERFDALVLSPGAEPVKPPIPGINDERVFTIRSVPDTDAVKKIIDTKRPERAVVIVGGFIGLEMAENIHHRVIMVLLSLLIWQFYQLAYSITKLVSIIKHLLERKLWKISLYNHTSFGVIHLFFPDFHINR